MNFILEFFRGVFAVFYNGILSYKIFFGTLDYASVFYIGISLASAIYMYRIEVKHQLVKVSKVKRVNL